MQLERKNKSISYKAWHKVCSNTDAMGQSQYAHVSYILLSF